MDGLSTAASALAVVSVAVQLADTCMKLYYFWESVRDAPEDVAFIMEDLKYLSTVVEDIARDKSPMSTSVAVGLKVCQNKMRELTSIAEAFEDGFRSSSRKARIWTSIRASTRMKQLQKFRDSLNDTKSTLMLALMYQSIRRTDTNPTLESVDDSEDEPPPYSDADDISRTTLLRKAEIELKRQTPAILHKKLSPDASEITPPPKDGALVSSDIMKKILKHSVEQAIEKLVDSGTIQELMARAIANVTTFESTSVGKFNSVKDEVIGVSSPHSDINDDIASHQDDETSTNGRPIRSRVCHRVSSYGSAFGCIWVRASTVHTEVRPNSSGQSFQAVTSFVFYPASWLKRIGVRDGIEVNLVDGWKFEWNPVRAVPEHSPIFALCQAGETKSVELLIKNGLGSVLDTSPKGWTPLHYAAAAGHVELCRALIGLGADKTALAYEGPSTDTLSPIALFASLAGDLSSEIKINMLRLFADCLDLSDPHADGWTVHAELKRAYNKEKAPVSRNSIMWLLRITASEKFVAFGPKTIWSAVQHAVRSFLVHERSNGVLQKLLDLQGNRANLISNSHATAFAHWFALRGSERELLPMVLDAGRFCQIQGFDWVEDDITPSQFIKALPVIYATWSIALPNSVDKVEELIMLELDACLARIGWTREGFVKLLSTIGRDDEDIDAYDDTCRRCCSACGDSYGHEGLGLVQPSHIAFTECTKTGHRMNCNCPKFLVRYDLNIPVMRRSDSPHSEAMDSDCDEEFFDAEATLPDRDSHRSTTAIADPFLDAATMLYRAQGRTWIGHYNVEEELCATCFLLREEYIGEDGLGTERVFSPMPLSFEMFRADVKDCTVEGESN